MKRAACILAALGSFFLLQGCPGPGGADKSFGKKADIGTLTISLGSAHFGASPAIGKRNVPLGSVQDVVLMQLRAEADSVEGISLGSLVIDAAGSGHDQSDLALSAPVSLYFDADADGAIDSPGDPLLDSRSFSGDNGSAVMTVNRTIPAGGFEHYIVAYDFNAGASAAGGETFLPMVDAATAVVATGTASGAAPMVNGGTISGAIAEIVGSLAVDEGLQNPAARSLSSYAAGVVMLQASLAADSAESIRLNSVTLTASGTGNDAADVQSVEVYSDANSNGALDPGIDLKLGITQTYASNNGTLTFSGLNHTTPPGATTNIIVVYAFNCATGNFTYEVRIDAAGFSATGVLSGEPPFMSGAPVAGSTVTTIRTGILTVSKGANCPVSNVFVPEGTANQPVLQANLVVDSYEAVTMTQVVFNHSGTGSIAGGTPDAASFLLYFDADGSGTLTPGDQLIGNAPTVAAATITFNFSRTIGASSSENWLLMYTFAAGLANSGGHTFSASIASNSSISASGAISGPLGATITPVGNPSFPIAGPAPTVTLIETLTVSKGANDPGNQSYMPTAVRVALQIRFDATCGPVSVTSLTLTPSGTGNDSSALSALGIYADDGNGVYDGTETLIVSGVYSADDTSRTYNFSAQTVTPGTPLFWIVVYTLSGGNPGDTFRTEANQASHVSASGTGSSQSLTPQGTYPVQGGIISYSSVSLTVSAASTNPSSNAAVSRNTSNVLMLGLNIAAANGSADVTSLTITASGKGDDNLHISSAEVYEDTNNDGVGDTLLATNSTPYSSDDGTTTFSFSSPYPQITSGTSENWVVVYNFNANNVWVGCTFRAGIAQNSDLSAQDASSGSSATVTGVGTGIFGAYMAIEGIWNQMTVQNSGIVPSSGLLWHMATYDAANDAMIVFGGLDLSTFNGNAQTLMMTLSGTRGTANAESWKQIHPGGTSLSDPPGMMGSIYHYYNTGSTPEIVLSGGLDLNSTWLTTTWIYDLTNNKWSLPSVTGNPPQDTSGAGLWFMSSAVDTSQKTPRVVVFGGSDGSGNYYQGTHFLSLGTSMGWTQPIFSTTPPTARDEAPGVYDASTTTPRFLVLGGFDAKGNVLSSADSLSLGNTPSWGTISSLNTGRYCHTAVVDPTVGQIIVFGGIDASSNILSDIEVYVLTSGSSVWQWTQQFSTGSFPTRQLHTAVWDLNTHRMIVFAGDDGSNYYTDVWELY